MQFLVIAYDGEDPGAFERRLDARAAHIELGNTLRDAGRHLYGAAILDAEERMIGSVMIVDFPDRAELDQWLLVEPYVTGDVWKKVEIQPCRVGPSFQKLKPTI